MKAQTRATPRKSPKQQRSQSLVGSVVEATARILDLSGYAAMSTNRVAEIAGVSIGSLYQYFPGKDALVVAVLERQIRQKMAFFESEVEATAHLPRAERLELMVRRIVDDYMAHPRIMRELFVQGSRLDKFEMVLSVRRQVVAIVARLIDGDEKKAYVVVNAIMGVMMTSMVDDKTPLDRETMKDELIKLMKTYVGC